MKAALWPWWKWATDLSGTRTQVVIAIVSLWLLVAWRTYTLIKTVQDGIALLGVMNQAFMAALGAWLAAKGVEAAKTVATVAANSKAQAPAPKPDPAGQP